MAWELIELVFMLPEPGHCCVLCNPRSVADYETECVVIAGSNGQRAYICRPCVRSLYQTVRPCARAATNEQDLAHWGKLSVRALKSQGAIRATSTERRATSTSTTTTSKAAIHGTTRRRKAANAY